MPNFDIITEGEIVETIEVCHIYKRGGNIFMKKSWIFPLVVLTLLLITPYFRWVTEATKSPPDSIIVLKWKTDRWTGVQIKETYNAREIKSERIKNGDTWPYDDQIATVYWKNILIVVLSPSFITYSY